MLTPEKITAWSNVLLSVAAAAAQGGTNVGTDLAAVEAAAGLAGAKAGAIAQDVALLGPLVGVYRELRDELTAAAADPASAWPQIEAQGEVLLADWEKAKTESSS
jgi:hypothetical protein